MAHPWGSPRGALIRAAPPPGDDTVRLPGDDLPDGSPGDRLLAFLLLLAAAALVSMLVWLVGRW